MTTNFIKPCLLKIYFCSRFFFSKSLTLSQYRRRPEFILNTVLKYNLKNKQISRPNPKIVYIYIQQISIEVFLLYENDYQTYGFFLLKNQSKGISTEITFSRHFRHVYSLACLSGYFGKKKM